MKVLLFQPEKANCAGDHLERIIGEIVPRGDFQVYHSTEDLFQRLRRPWEQLEIAVLLAANKRELDEFISLRDLLEHLRLILVLYDDEKGTVAKGHRLRPRFLTYADKDLTEVGAVLTKMLGTMDSK